MQQSGGLNSPSYSGSGAEEAIRTADRILIPAIAFWDTALLIRKGRLRLKRGKPASEWAAEVL